VGANTLDNTDDYEAELHALADELGIANAVYFRPFQQDVRHAYAALDIFILASQAETFGMVTVEAMAAGLPVIATRSGGTLRAQRVCTKARRTHRLALIKRKICDAGFAASFKRTEILTMQGKVCPRAAQKFSVLPRAFSA
jgi:hypothetical protein